MQHGVTGSNTLLLACLVVTAVPLAALTFEAVLSYAESSCSGARPTVIHRGESSLEHLEDPQGTVIAHPIPFRSGELLLEQSEEDPPGAVIAHPIPFSAGELLWEQVDPDD